MKDFISKKVLDTSKASAAGAEYSCKVPSIVMITLNASTGTPDCSVVNQIYCQCPVDQLRAEFCRANKPQPSRSHKKCVQAVMWFRSSNLHAFACRRAARHKQRNMGTVKCIVKARDTNSQEFQVLLAPNDTGTNDSGTSRGDICQAKNDRTV